MEFPAALAATAEKYRRPAMIASGVLTLVAVVLCLLPAGRKQQYQSIALLLYAGNAGAAPGSAPLSATTAATARLDDAHLQKLAEHYDLYPELRKKQTPADLLGAMRANITLTQPDGYSLQVGFRDENSQRSQDVTNSLAAVLEADVSPAANTQPLATTQPQVPAAIEDQRSARVLNKDDLHRRIAHVDGMLKERTENQSMLQDESAENTARIRTISSTHVTTNPAESTPVVDPYAGTRTSLREQIAAEQQHLAALLVRYTEAYPDVEEAREKLSQLQEKLAAVPPPPVTQRVRAQNLFQKQIDDLTEEESRLGEQLRSNEREIAALQKQRSELVAKLGPAGAGSAAGQPTGQGAVAAPAAVTGLQSAIPASTHPFRILQNATVSVVVGSIAQSRSGFRFLWVMLAGAVFGFFVFLPRLPLRDTLLLTAEDMRKVLPGNAVFLGTIKRIEL